MLALDVGLVQIAAIRASSDRLLVCLPRDVLRESSHVFPSAPSGVAATALVELTGGDRTHVFLAVLDQALFDAGSVFIVDRDAPAEMMPFDLDWGHVPLASEMVAAAISLGFFDVDGMGSAEA